MAAPKPEPEENECPAERSAKLLRLFELDGSAWSNATIDQPSADDEIFEWVVALLKRSNVMRDNVICLRLVERLAEHVGYESAGNLDRNNVTELMLIAARAAELAKKVPRYSKY